MSIHVRALRIVVLLSVITIFTAACAPRWNEIITEMKSKGRYIDVDGLNVFYREAGLGPDIVLIHGFGSSTVTWEKLIPLLAPRFHVYAFDVVGFGLTEKPDDSSYYSFDSFVEQTVKFMDSVGVERAILAGNSMGGAIALGAALDYPQRVDKLILLDAGGYPLNLPLSIKLYKMPVLGDIGRFFINKWLIGLNLKDVYFDDDKLTDRWVEYYTAPFKTANGYYGPQQFVRNTDLHGNDMSTRFKEVVQPTLIVWGENDSWIPLAHAHRFQEDISDSKLVVIPECGHVPEEEKPAETAKAIWDFYEQE